MPRSAAFWFQDRKLNRKISSYYVRSSTATDTSPSGVLSVVGSGTPAFDRNNGLILEAARTNLLYNTGFSGAASGSPGTAPTGWTLFQTGGATTVSAIDLGNSITYTTTAARIFNRQTVSVSANTTYVMSSVVSAISGSVTYIEALQLFGAPSGASVTYRHNGVAVTSTNVIAASGVLEIVLTVAGTAGTVDVRMGLGAGVSITGSITHAYPQFEAGAFRSSYIFNNKGTNLLLRSQEFDNASWVKYNCTVTANQAVAPDGTMTADLIQFSAQYGNIRENFATLVAGTTYTYSIFCRVASGTRQFHVYDNIGVALGSFTATTSWARYSITFVAPNTTALFAIQDRATSGFVDTYIWGAQLNRDAYAFPYEATTSSAAAATLTRATSYLGGIPVSSMGIASQTNEYSFAFAVKMLHVTASKSSFTVLFSLGASSNDRVWVEFSSNDGQINFSKRYGGVSAGGVSVTGLTWSVGDVLFIRGSVGAVDGMRVYVNSSSGSGSTAGHKAAFTAAATEVALNATVVTLGNPSNGVFSGFQVWDRALSQAELERLTINNIKAASVGYKPKRRRRRR